MTAKEVEHFLIDNNFEYIAGPFFSYWENKRKDIGIADVWIQTNSDWIMKYLQKVLAS